MKIARFIIAAAALLATPAHAVPLIGEAAQTCALGMFYTNPNVSLPNVAPYNTCPTMELRDQLAQYTAARVEPGMAAVPIDLFGAAYYVDNRSTDSIFVPAATPDEWYAFLRHRPDKVDATPACRPVSLKNTTTCDDQVTINYDRAGKQFTTQVGTAGRVLTFTCVGGTNAGQWVMTASNGKACSKTAGTASAPDDFSRTASVVAVQQGWAVQRNFQ